MKWLYLQGHLSRVGDSLIDVIIRGVQVNISTWAITRMLYGIELQPLINTFEINFCMSEIQKIKRKKIDIEVKLIYFLWKASLTAAKREEVLYIIEEGGPSSQLITRVSVNFVAKAWWILVRHRLYPTYEDNIISPNRAALVNGIMASYY